MLSNETDVSVRLSTKEYLWLCFTHAVGEAMFGKEVKQEISDFSVDWPGPSRCVLCDPVAMEVQKNIVGRTVKPCTAHSGK